MSTPTSQHQAVTTPEQLLSHQQLFIKNLSSKLVAMKESASESSPTAQHSNYRYKASKPTPFAGASDTLKPWILQVDTHLQLASISNPSTQFLVAAQFLVAGPLSWVQTLTEVATLSDLKSQMMSYYQPLLDELRARRPSRATSARYSRVP
jgi:hypothetical protein